jgi:hypothetical protein
VAADTAGIIVLVDDSVRIPLWSAKAAISQTNDALFGSQTAVVRVFDVTLDQLVTIARRNKADMLVGGRAARVGDQIVFGAGI